MHQNKWRSEQHECSYRRRYFGLGDTGAQCHVRKAKENYSGQFMFSIRMGDRSKVDILRKEDIMVESELGININLKHTRVVKENATNIIS